MANTDDDRTFLSRPKILPDGTAHNGLENHHRGPDKCESRDTFLELGG